MFSHFPSSDGMEDFRCAASKGKIDQQSKKAIVIGDILKRGPLHFNFPFVT
jgi:hypothetical protein